MILMNVGLICSVIIFLSIIIFKSLYSIGPSQIGLVIKTYGKELPGGNPIALKGEAGYQAGLLMPGLIFKLWPLYRVEKHPWVQVPAEEIGLVISQVGNPLDLGTKSAIYKKEFKDFSDLDSFIKNGGQKGVQRQVLPPGTTVPIHPVAFIVLVKDKTYGVPISSMDNYKIDRDLLKLVRIEPMKKSDGSQQDVIGIVTTYEGAPLEDGDIASRMGGFKDIGEMEKIKEISNFDVIDKIFSSLNNEHNNYQDFQKFLDKGGKIGLQHCPLQYGSFVLNPYLVKVEIVPMLVVNQGYSAVIKSYVGLPTNDISGKDFKFGSLVKPGHKGIWEEALRTGKYPINPRCYQAVIVPTFILTLNWANSVSQAHCLDANLNSITAKSVEGFVFKLDLQVQIHIPDTNSPKVISMVGTTENLINEVLQAAIGNYLRNTIGGMKATEFITNRQKVQQQALTYIQEQLNKYFVETKGVYIQDIILPAEIVKVLTEREIAEQQIGTFEKQKSAEDKRVEMEKAKGMANMQSQLASSEVQITIANNKSDAKSAEARGEASYVEQMAKAEASKVESIGLAEAKKIEAGGLAKAKGYEAQVSAMGQTQTAMVNIFNILAEKGIKIIPDSIIVGGGGGSLDGLALSLMKFFDKKTIPEINKNLGDGDKYNENF